MHHLMKITWSASTSTEEIPTELSSIPPTPTASVLISSISASILLKKIFLNGIEDGKKLLLFPKVNLLSSELGGPQSIILFTIPHTLDLISEFLRTILSSTLAMSTIVTSFLTKIANWWDPSRCFLPTNLSRTTTWAELNWVTVWKNVENSTN